MRIIKGIKVILFVILFILMNLLLSYFLVRAKSGTDLRNPISGADAECKCKSNFRKSKKLWVLIVGKTETGLELCNKQ